MKLISGFLLSILIAGVSLAQDPIKNSKFYINSDSDSIGLVAEYFNNKTLTGEPTNTTVETIVFHKWRNAPDVDGIPKDNFSIRWTGVIRCESTGDYIFHIAGDDGYRLFIDDKKVIEVWKNQALNEKKETIHLKKGKEYSVKLEYYEASGDAEIYFAYYNPELIDFSFVPEISWANTERYKNDNIVLSSKPLAENRVVFMGNSITQNWGSMRTEFFEKNPYICRGIGGQTTPQMLVRFRPDVIKLKPSAVIILAGTNDIAGNTGLTTLEKILDNIISMAELAKANNIKVILCSVLPAYDYPWRPGLEPAGKIINLNKMIKEYADNNGILYLDYFSHMADEKNGLKKEYSSDGVHPNAAGYEVMEPLAKEAINKVLGL